MKDSGDSYILAVHTVCRYTCRGLFECHKLLFSFHMCAKILEVAGKLNMDEYSFFLRGGLVSTFSFNYVIFYLISNDFAVLDLPQSEKAMKKSAYH